MSQVTLQVTLDLSDCDQADRDWAEGRVGDWLTGWESEQAYDFDGLAEVTANKGSWTVTLVGDDAEFVANRVSDQLCLTVQEDIAPARISVGEVENVIHEEV